MRFGSFWLFLVVLAWARPSAAGDSAAAEALFQQGKALLDRGETEAACPKFQASIEAEPSIGAHLNLARCHETLGRTATAWAEYLKAAALAQRHGDSRRERGARERADKLEGGLSRLTLEVARAPEGLRLRLQGEPVPEASWGSPLPVDPGVQIIEASAPGKQPWRGEVTVLPDGDRKSVMVPELGDVEGDTSIDHAAAREIPADEALTTAGIIVTSFGVAALGVGVGLGVKALGDTRALERDCPSRSCLGAEARASEIEPWAHGATAGVVVGAVGIVSGVAMILLGESAGEPAVLPTAGPDGATLWLRRRF